MKKINIVGGGASGIFLALLLSSENIEVNVFEQDDRILKKLMATGNGRCNFTNENLSLNFYRGGNTDFLSKAFDKFDNQDMINFMEDLGMGYKALDSGRVYPYTMSGKTFRNILESNLDKNRVKIWTEKKIVLANKINDSFIIRDSDGQDYKSDYLVLANGGYRNIRKNHYSNGYDLAQSFGHSRTEVFPGIVQIALEEKEVRKMKNIKFNSRVSIYADGKFIEGYEDDTLFADYGVSGLSILQLSNEILYQMKEAQELFLSLDLMPGVNKEGIESIIKKIIARNPYLEARNLLEGYIQEEIFTQLLNRININPSLWISKLREEEITRIVRQVKDYRFRPKGPKSQDDGQISCGGIKTHEVNSETMESKLIKNLFFAGEILDVQGDSGGYNLQWAWSSAYTIKEYIIKDINK